MFKKILWSWLEKPLFKMRQSFILRILIMLPAMYLGISIPNHISVTLTRSMDHRVYFLDLIQPNQIKRGAYVLFDIPIGLIKDLKMNKAIKRVGCIGGNTLRVKKGDYFCDAVYLGTAKPYSINGKPLQSFSYDGVIPAKKLFMVGDSVDSYDSRYWGFLDQKEVSSSAYPIF